MVVLSNLSPAPSDLTSSPEGSLAESDIKPIVRKPSLIPLELGGIIATAVAWGSQMACLV